MFASPAAVSPEGTGRPRRARQIAMMCAAMACAFAAATGGTDTPRSEKAVAAHNAASGKQVADQR